MTLFPLDPLLSGAHLDALEKGVDASPDLREMTARLCASAVRIARSDTFVPAGDDAVSDLTGLARLQGEISPESFASLLNTRLKVQFSGAVLKSLPEGRDATSLHEGILQLAEAAGVAFSGASVEARIATLQAEVDVLIRVRRGLLRREAEANAGAPLPDRVREAILQHDPAHLASMSTITIRSLLRDPAASDGDICAAMSLLVGEDAPIVGESWYVEGVDGSDVWLGPEDVAEWRESGILIHPETGEEIPSDSAWFEWVALPRDPSPEPC